MNVLIVDDDIATVEVIKTSIDWQKLLVQQVFCSYNIDQAKSILEENLIDIVISDIEMPQGSGLDLLRWYREQNYKGEFLFLTCHESFSYASDAVKLHAFEYLLKPINIAAIEESVKKVIFKINTEKEKQQVISQHLKSDYYKSVLEGFIGSNFEQEAKQRGFDIDESEEYILITSRLTNTKRNLEKMTPDMFLFMVENIHKECFFCDNEKGFVICFEYNNSFMVASICRKKYCVHVEALVKKLLESIKNTLSVNITVCIGEPCQITDLYELYHKHISLLTSSASYTDSYFFDYQMMDNTEDDNSLIDIKEYEAYFISKDKLKILSSLKNLLYQKVQEHSLNDMMLFTLRQKLNQCVYNCFASYGINPNDFMTSQSDVELSVSATESMANMIKWAGYLVDCYVSKVEQSLNTETEIEKINRFIREHYSENIGRNEVAEYVHLAPEYVAKLYKKKTDMTIKDYLNEYRILQSKKLLENNALRVSDISDMVGFESFTYFSTIFKKYTNMTPNEYRKSLKI